MDAALDLMIQEGYNRFSASKVASRAGVSRGAQENYYPLKIDLVAAATRHAMDIAFEQAKAMAENTENDASPVARFMQSSEGFFFAPSYIAMTEVLIAARADHELAEMVHPIIREARTRLDSLWIDTLSQEGHTREQAAEFIEMSNFLLRGLFYVESWAPYDVSRAEVIQRWQNYARAIFPAA